MPKSEIITFLIIFSMIMLALISYICIYKIGPAVSNIMIDESLPSEKYDVILIEKISDPNSLSYIIDSNNNTYCALDSYFTSLPLGKPLTITTKLSSNHKYKWIIGYKINEGTLNLNKTSTNNKSAGN